MYTCLYKDNKNGKSYLCMNLLFDCFIVHLYVSKISFKVYNHNNNNLIMMTCVLKAIYNY